MKKTYAEKLKDPRWQKKRLQILERDGWKCVVTGEKNQTLHVHHRRYHKDPWDAPNEELETVCEWVHEAISNFDKGLRSYYKDASISARDIMYSIVTAADTEARLAGHCDSERALNESPFWHIALLVWMEIGRIYDPDFNNPKAPAHL